jgi:hypothetical protein
MLDSDSQVRDAELVKQCIADLFQQQQQQILRDKYSLANVLAARIAANNKFSDFEVNQLMHALTAEIEINNVLHLIPNLVLVIKKKVSLVSSAGSIE